MEIDIPVALGQVEVNKLGADKNIVFASDFHTSWHAQKNISLLYIHLAEQYGLKTVSRENIVESQGLQKRAPRGQRMFWEGLIKSGRVGDFMKDSSGEIFHHINLIIYSAIFLGFNLNIVDAGLEREITQLDLLNDYYSDLNGDDQIYADALQHRFQALNPRLKAALSSTGNLTLENIRYHRTLEHISSVAEAMQQSGETLALVCRGVAYKENFISVAEELGLGYLIFRPEGLFIENVLLRSLYDIEIGSAQQKLVE